MRTTLFFLILLGSGMALAGPYKGVDLLTTTTIHDGKGNILIVKQPEFLAPDCVITEVKGGGDGLWIAFTGKWTRPSVLTRPNKNGIWFNGDQEGDQKKLEALAAQARDLMGKHTSISVNSAFYYGGTPILSISSAEIIIAPVQTR